MTDDTRHAARTGARRRRRQADEEPVTLLEQDQLAVGNERPVARARLSKRVNAALWALRIFVIVVSAMVIYTFFSQLGR
jgi:hypothetical protein